MMRRVNSEISPPQIRVAPHAMMPSSAITKATGPLIDRRRRSSGPSHGRPAPPPAPEASAACAGAANSTKRVIAQSSQKAGLRRRPRILRAIVIRSFLDRLSDVLMAVMIFDRDDLFHAPTACHLLNRND